MAIETLFKKDSIGQISYEVCCCCFLNLFLKMSISCIDSLPFSTLNFCSLHMKVCTFIVASRHIVVFLQV